MQPWNLRTYRPAAGRGDSSVAMSIAPLIMVRITAGRYRMRIGWISINP